jgi:aerobic-type carbon monoxide dehydrogenase small subunit (CoxS/CutS family)
MSARVFKSVDITVNGATLRAEVETRQSLAEFLRAHAGLTGTHIGCDTSQCGACTVHVDGVGLKSCTLLAVQANGTVVTTIEGLAVQDACASMWFLHARHGNERTRSGAEKSAADGR